MSTVNPRPMYYSKIHIDPTNDQRIYILGCSTSSCRTTADGPSATR